MATNPPTPCGSPGTLLDSSEPLPPPPSPPPGTPPSPTQNFVLKSPSPLNVQSDAEAEADADEILPDNRSKNNRSERPSASRLGGKTYPLPLLSARNVVVVANIRKQSPRQKEFILGNEVLSFNFKIQKLH